MLSLNKQEQDLSHALSKSEDGVILSGYIQKVIDELSDIDSLKSDIIENRKVVKSTLRDSLLYLLQDRPDPVPDEDPCRV